MKIVISVIAMVVLTIGAPLAFQHMSLDVFALSVYQSGYNHGVSDGSDNCTHSDGCHWYILQPGKGFQFHSWDFVRGYVTGFCSVSPDEAAWDCAKGPTSASWVSDK